MSLVSVVIPTYENTALAAGAIESCLKQKDVNFEVLVSDDSRSDLIKVLVQDLGDPRVRYIRHQGKGCAVENWNFGLSMAQGQHLVLLHHDEFFAHELVLAQGSRDLMNRPGVLVFGHEVRFADGRVRHRSRLAAVMVRLIPSCLYFSNFIGAPSNLMFPRQLLTQDFRHDLRWLVDLEWMFVNFSRVPIHFSNQIDLISLADEGMSITRSLDVSAVEKREVSLLLSEGKSVSVSFFLIARLVKRYIKDFLEAMHVRR